MERTKDGKWETAVLLEPGNYRYCYLVIDNDSVADPHRSLLFSTSVINSGSVVSVPAEGPDGRPSAHDLN